VETGQFFIYFVYLDQLLNEVQVPNLTGLVNAVGILVEPLEVVELQAFGRGRRVLNKQKKGYYGSSCSPFAVVAVHRDHSSFVLFVR
jgi:hypothetical protein